MLRLVMGTDWVAIREEMLKRVAGDVAAEQGGRVYMVPELISHDTERRLCQAAGDTASRYAEVLSFTRLARRVSESMGRAQCECLDAGGRVVAMAAAVRQLSSRLKAYASVETKPEFLTELVDAVDEFKRCCITEQDLLAASAQTQGSLAQKLEELSLILGAYDSLCARGKRDPRDRETVLLEQLADGDFGERHVFYIEGFPDLTRQHMEILEHLIRVSPEVTVGINCDGPDSRLMAFEKAGATAGELIRCARRAGVAVTVERLPDRDDALGRLCRGIFQGALPRIDGDVLTALRGQSVYDEVLLTAERVRELVRGGCRYRDIGIACGDMGTYENPVDLIFHRCRIPVYRSGKEDILQKTVLSTVIAAMEAALGGFERQDVMRYLRSVLSPLDMDICDRMENYAVLWGVRGKYWLQEWKNHPDGLGGIWSEETYDQLRALNEAREQALSPLTRLRRRFDSAQNLAEQIQGLYAFLEEVCLAQRLQALAQELDARGDDREAQILNQLWEILVGAMEQMYDVLGQTVWDTETFTRLFKLLLSQYDVGTIPPVLDQVTVGPVSAMRCQQVKHVIVLGAAEGALPGYGGATGLLTDQERVALRALGVSLTGGAMEGIQAEFAEIYGVFCGAQSSVTVLCSGAQPSYIYRRLAEMAGGELQRGPTPGAAAGDREDAAAWLVKWKDSRAAERLGLTEAYEQLLRKARYEMGSVSREHVTELYGSRLRLSASQIDRQAECRMSYFLRYGIRAKERREVTVDPAEFGTYVHAVLEQTAREVMARGGFQEVSLEDTLRIAMEYSEAYARERFADIDSARITYLFHRNRRELEMVVAELWQELRSSRFVPSAFELRFGDGERMDAIEVGTANMPASLRGLVDRVDIWQADGRHYFRVVDYKTGKKDFDYCDVFNGVGLQMLLYLFALEQNGFGTGAGVQYFPARAPLISTDGAMTQEEAQALREKKWKRKGLLLEDEAVLDAMDPNDWQRLNVTRRKDGTLTGDLADREQLRALRQYVRGLLGALVEDIASGNVQPDPYTRGTSHDACGFCPYDAICRKASVQGRRNYKAMSAEKFWEEVEKEVERNG